MRSHRGRIALGMVTLAALAGCEELGESGRSRASTARLSEELVLTPSSAEEGETYGLGLALGDVDGDGYDEVIVGAPGRDTVSSPGSVYVYSGSASGVDASTEVVLEPSDGAAQDWYGWSVAAVDLDGDGYVEVVVGSPQTESNGRGAVYLYGGTAAGVDVSSELVLSESSLDTRLGYGWDVDGAGDVDGDGYEDLVVGSTMANAAWVYPGSSRGVDTSSGVELASSSTLAFCFGRAVAGAGDVDGDGYDDVIVGDLGDGLDGLDGSAWIFTGSATGASTTGTYILPSDGSRSYFGHAVDGAGDVNADGYDDVLIGAPHTNQSDDAGEAWLYLGSSAGVDTDTEVVLEASTFDKFGMNGYAVAGIGDQDGDGYDDVLVGAWGWTGGGEAWLFRGSAAGIDTSVELPLSPSCKGSSGWGLAGGDVDGDGFADAVVGALGADAPSGVSSGAATVFMGTCDVPSPFYADTDGDGYGDPDVSTEACAAPSGFVADATDCDDTDAWVHPGHTEVCDSIDNDCDEVVDEGEAWYPDADRDSYGDAEGTPADCDGASLDVADASDCDDTDDQVNPEATEVCTGYDDDCDDLVDDEDDSVEADTWYEDADGDGYGLDASEVRACEPPEGHVAVGGDCDDIRPGVFPGADERCDERDDDCDGEVDEEAIDAGTWSADEDGDGVGGTGPTVRACEPPEGFGDASGVRDCDDTDPTVLPGAREHCDGVDEDCDGQVDDEAVDATTWYEDGDGDGYATLEGSATACECPEGYAVLSELDCDDTDGGVFPGAEEVPGDGVDQDCDGVDGVVEEGEEAGCGCASGGVSGVGWLVVVAVFGVRRRRVQRGHDASYRTSTA